MFRSEAQMSKNYKEIIDNNIRIYGVRAGYAYHYTDVTNAVNILATGHLYSREKCNEKKLMQNDNASSSVISNTSTSIKNDVRFYFRPLTPTQYHNEGYKHPQVRFYSDINANVPVPIFFLFDLQKMLENIPEIHFTQMGRAGYSNIALLNGIESFGKLPFEKIYSTGFYDKNVDGDLKAYRHAELAVPEKFEILPYIKCIVCRNEVECSTLKNLLCDYDEELFKKYRPYILNNEITNLPIFEFNGLFIAEIQCDREEGGISIHFANHHNKINYDRNFQNHKLQPITLSAEILCLKGNKSFIHCHKSDINYVQPQDINICISNMFNVTSMCIKIHFDNCLMAYKKFFYDL